MSQLDDLFRDGLGDRRPPVSPDLWRKIAANKAPVPAGEQLDHLFADRLADRRATVPPGMWSRVVAARGAGFPYRRTAAAALLLLVGGLSYLLYPGASDVAEAAGGGAQVPNLTEVTAPSEVVVPTDGTHSVVPASLTDGGEMGAVNDPDSKEEPVRPSSVSIPGAEPVSREPLPIAAAIRRNPRLTAPLLSPPIAPLAPEETGLHTPPVVAAGDGRGFRGSDRHRFGGELLLGAAYAGQRLGLRDEAGRALRDAREISEFPEVSFQLSGRLRYRLTDRVRILTGLTYVQLRNQLEFESVRNGSRELVRSNNRFHLLEVPLLVSYSLPGRRLRVNVNAGPLLNVFTGAGGRYVDPDAAAPVRLSDSGLYRSNTGLGWMTSLTTTYVVGKQRNVQLLLEPFFKHYPSSFTHPRAELTETYWMGGIQLGLRKQL